MSGGGNDAVAVDVRGPIATITLQNPPANPLGHALAAGLDSALDVAVAEHVRVIVLRSSVPGYFAAGADLKLLGAVDGEGFRAWLTNLRRVIERLPGLAQLSIAAIDGYALGGGLELAMACTVRVATPRSRLGVPEVTLGLLPGAGGTQRLPRLVGSGKALDMMLTGRSVAGDEAARIGLVDHLAGDGEADEEALRLAESYSTGASDAMAAIVRCVQAARDLPLAQGMEVEMSAIAELFDGADAREGLAAFLAKRKPVFHPVSVEPMTTGLAHFTAEDETAAIVEALLCDGAVIVERLISREQIERVLDETKDFREATPMGTDGFSGRNTRRTGSLIARSPAVRDLVAHPVVLGVCDGVLVANATSYQLHLTQVIDIGPGEPAQPLHRDQWAWDFFPFPQGFEVEISTIWAMQEFTDEIGATRVVPGSHRSDWTFQNPPPVEASVPAEMPAGSVVIYTGSVFHGGGANRTDQRRVAVNIDYCLGWLRQEENQYLSCPPEVAKDLPVELAKLIGYSRAAYALGYFGDVQDPMEALHPGERTDRGFSPT